jgi:hypothetical protein
LFSKWRGFPANKFVFKMAAFAYRAASLFFV